MLLLDELGVTQGDMVDRLESWILAAQQKDGTVTPPLAELKAYPHGEWSGSPIRKKGKEERGTFSLVSQRLVLSGW